jgi:hypothetical protein
MVQLRQENTRLEVGLAITITDGTALHAPSHTWCEPFPVLRHAPLRLQSLCNFFMHRDVQCHECSQQRGGDLQ